MVYVALVFNAEKDKCRIPLILHDSRCFQQIPEPFKSYCLSSISIRQYQFCCVLFMILFSGFYCTNIFFFRQNKRTPGIK